ncbi:MAG: LptF/LptG family permease, partial [Cyanobacteria bacterium P01_E01_bin.6]
MLLGQQLLLFTDLLIQKGVSGSTVLQLLVLSLPAIAVLTFPIAGLFATLIVIARMGADFELAALRAAGVSYLRIFQPFILLGLVISALSFSVNDFVAPYTNHKVRLLNQSLLLSQDAIPLEPEQFLSIGDRRWLYVNSVESDTLEMAEILLFDFDTDSSAGHYPKLISADTARCQDGVLDLNLANVWQFNGDG